MQPMTTTDVLTTSAFGVGPPVAIDDHGGTELAGRASKDSLQQRPFAKARRDIAPKLQRPMMPGHPTQISQSRLDSFLASKQRPGVHLARISSKGIAMALKYLDPKLLSEKQKAELRKVLNTQLKEIQDKLNEIDQLSDKPKAPKKTKKTKR